jgi:hypothetical protein
MIGTLLDERRVGGDGGEDVSGGVGHLAKNTDVDVIEVVAPLAVASKAFLADRVRKRPRLARGFLATADETDER